MSDSQPTANQNFRLTSDIFTLIHDQLRAFSNSESFWSGFDTAFGTQYNRRTAETLQTEWQTGDFAQIPSIEVISSKILGNANGAYAASQNKIYLSENFVANATSVSLQAVFLEEIGHFVDAHINQVDSAGDEGAIFSALVQGKTFEPEQLQQLKAEDDTATITVNGQVIEIEQEDGWASYGDSGNLKETLSLEPIRGNKVLYDFASLGNHKFILSYEGQPILEKTVIATDGKLGRTNGTVDLPTGNSNELELEIVSSPSNYGYQDQRNYAINIIRNPVLILPGLAGSFVEDNNYQKWTFNRGLNPDDLVIDPLIHSYDDLIETLKNADYTEGEDLFIVPYDWRLPPGPTDALRDGKISGISGASITDSQYEYGVDYLGYWLKIAAEKWKERFTDPNQAIPLDSVDVIAHSTGGLVTRAYIQSDAYGASLGDLNLPKIDKFIMLGVPNEGAPKALNPINDDWNSDAANKFVMRQFANVPYQKLLKGAIINGPTPITQETVIAQSGNSDLTSKASKMAFIDQYTPTLKSLLATYDFGATVGTNQENSLLLDLNANFSSVTNNSNITVIYGKNIDTINRVEEKIGPEILSYNDGEKPPTYVKSIQSFTDLSSHEPASNEQWWEEFRTKDGDGTVPVRSSTYVLGNPNQIKAFNGVTHGGLPADKGVQEYILETLGAKLLEGGKISIDKAAKFWDKFNLAFAWSYTNDPVDGFLVDSQGRRLGYSEATGAVTEIPNSVWFGNQDGMGWVFGEVDSPVTVQLSGLGEITMFR